MLDHYPRPSKVGFLVKVKSGSIYGTPELECTNRNIKFILLATCPVNINITVKAREDYINQPNIFLGRILLEKPVYFFLYQCISAQVVMYKDDPQAVEACRR